MNRRQRRELERKGQIPKQEPVYSMKPTAMVDAVLNGGYKDIMMDEIHKNILAQERKTTIDIDTMVLWTLHNKYGWGKQRLKRFYGDLFEGHKEMREYYCTEEMYPERIKLKEKGIDVEAWYDELFNEDGSYKELRGAV